MKFLRIVIFAIAYSVYNMTLVLIGVWALSGSRYIFLGLNSRTSDLSEAILSYFKLFGGFWSWRSWDLTERYPCSYTVTPHWWVPITTTNEYLAIIQARKPQKNCKHQSNQLAKWENQKQKTTQLFRKKETAPNSFDAFGWLESPHFKRKRRASPQIFWAETSLEISWRWGFLLSS